VKSIQNKKIKIDFICFNYYNLGLTHNGPGISLWGLCSILKRKNIEFRVFSKMHSIDRDALDLSDYKPSKETTHTIIWSGLRADVYSYLRMFKVDFILGPNMFDNTNIAEEKRFLSYLKPKKFIFINDMVRFKVIKTHNIDPSITSTFSAPPDLSLWKSEKKEDFVLWKGNSRHLIKNVSLASKIERLIPEIPFVFIKDYKYKEHIELAKKAKIYISTSDSETLSMNLLEQLSCGTPCVINKDHFLWGENYKTTIISEKNEEAYATAISELWYNDELYRYMNKCSSKWIEENFSDDIVLSKFLECLC
jgi:hypothetical protein